MNVDFLYHYFFTDPSEEIVASICEKGLRPLSAQPDRAARLAEIERWSPGHFERLYHDWAEPILRHPYNGVTGVFLTPIDFRHLAGSLLETATRVAVPLDRIDPRHAVLTYQSDRRVSLPLSRTNLERTRADWPDTRINEHFGIDPERVFYLVPQAVSYQTEPIPVNADDIQRAPG